jgi:hypothetical protein
LIELKNHEKAHSVEELVAAHLAKSGERLLNLDAFPYMLREGRVVLLFDGFDELALRTDYDGVVAHFRELLRVFQDDRDNNRAKLVVTSRRQFFESEQQVQQVGLLPGESPRPIGFQAARTDLYKHAKLLPGLRRLELLGFDPAHIRDYMLHRLGDKAAAEKRFELIQRIEDLLGLSSTPRLLSFIVELEEDRLLEAERRDGRITSAELYRLLLERWLDFEVRRHKPAGAPRTLEQDDRFQAVRTLAVRLWEKNAVSLKVSELSEHLEKTLTR